VSEIVISGVTTTRRREIDWLYRGVRCFFPEAWQRFQAGVPETDRDADLVAAYARLLNDPDVEVRTRAAKAWCVWEDTVVSLEPHGKPNAYSDRDPAALLAFVRICTHYFAHNAWLEEGALLRDAGRLTGIPGVLIHGRLDLSCPVETAWELAQAWPEAELVVVDDAGHQASDSKRVRILGALDTFARR
jgi:proline iminopeptidase